MSEENRVNGLPPQQSGQEDPAFAPAQGLNGAGEAPAGGYAANGPAAAGGEAPEGAAPGQAPAYTAPCPPPLPPRPPVRRVGTFTLGLALIATGLVITAAFFVPNFDVVFAAKLAPLVLVFLGAEVLWATAHPDGRRIKFDFLSAFVGFVLICASLCAATLPVVWRWYGPDRALTQQRLAGELEDQLFDQLGDQDLLRCSVWVNLSTGDFDRQMTAADLRPGDQVGANITLGGKVESADDFAARVAALLPALRQAGVTQVYFFWGDDADQWDLDLYGDFAMSASAETLAGMARHQLYLTDADGDSYWAEEDEIAARAADGQTGPDSTPAQEPAVTSAPEPAAETAPAA